MEKELHTEKLTVERKIFFFDLKENERGRFLKITEDVGGRRDTIIIPAIGLREFGKAIDAILAAEKELPFVESRPPQPREDDGWL